MKSTKTTLTLSIIIPVFNEEIHIGRCLESIANQTDMPDEVILVDNNCTDRTVEIAKKYPFVKVVKEKKQGIAHARSKGFDTASSEILGRIDADSELYADWVKDMKSQFHNSKVSAVSSWADTSFIPFINTPKSHFFSKAYYLQVEQMIGHPLVWGATMAITNKAWHTVKDNVINSLKVHEDQALGLAIVEAGMTSIILEKQLVSMSGQSYRYLPNLYKYWIMQYRLAKMKPETVEKLKKTAPNMSLINYVYFLCAGLVILFFGILTFPLDYFGVTVFGKRRWFEFHWEYFRNKLSLPKI